MLVNEVVSPCDNGRRRAVVSSHLVGASRVGRRFTHHHPVELQEDLSPFERFK